MELEARLGACALICALCESSAKSNDLIQVTRYEGAELFEHSNGRAATASDHRSSSIAVRA